MLGCPLVPFETNKQKGTEPPKKRTSPAAKDHSPACFGLIPLPGLHPRGVGPRGPRGVGAGGARGGARQAQRRRQPAVAGPRVHLDALDSHRCGSKLHRRGKPQVWVDISTPAENQQGIEDMDTLVWALYCERKKLGNQTRDSIGNSQVGDPKGWGTCFAYLFTFLELMY